MNDSIDRNRYNPAAHAIGTDKVNPDPHGLMQARSARQFGSLEEAVAAVENAIRLLKSGQIDPQRLAAVMKAALPVIEQGRESLTNVLARPYIDPRGGR
jgi:hypothetical protein